MMEVDEKSKGSWWQTAPGILTAIGGIITALAGLILALHGPASSVTPGSAPPPPYESSAHKERQRGAVPIVTPPAVTRPYNMSFDMPIEGRQPIGWFNGDGVVDSVSTAYEIKVIPRPDGEKGACVLFQNPTATKDDFGTLMQRFPALYLASKTIRLEGEVKTKDVREWAGLWLRADDDDFHTLIIDNMETRPIRGTTSWTKYTIDVELPRETVWLNYGILLKGSGMMWADNFRLLVWNIEKGEWTDL